MQVPTDQRRMTWFIIVLAHSVLPVLLGIFLMGRAPEQPVPSGSGDMIFMAIAAASLLGAVFMARSRLMPTGPVGEAPTWPSPHRFQTDSLVALAFSELAPLLAIFLISTRTGESVYGWAFVAGSIAVNLFVILPLGIAFWNVQKEKGGGV